MDLACEKHLHIPFDKNGSLAAKGIADKTLVQKLLKQKYFSQKPPKSLDKNDFGETYLNKYFPLRKGQRTEDLLATLNLFSAACVAMAIQKFVPPAKRKKILVSGGGAFNKTLLKNLQELTQLPIYTSQHYGLDPQAKEAAAFALMAWLTLNKKSNHCPHATGAKKKIILGRITL